MYLRKRCKVFWGDVAIAPQRPGHSCLLKDSHHQPRSLTSTRSPYTTPLTHSLTPLSKKIILSSLSEVKTAGGAGVEVVDGLETGRAGCRRAGPPPHAPAPLS